MSTARVDSYIQRGSHPGFEFSTNPAAYRGQYFGVESKAGLCFATGERTSGVSYHHFQFEGPLKGAEPRVLQLYLPVLSNNTYDGMLEETRSVLPDGGKGSVVFVVGDASRVLGAGGFSTVLQTRYGIPRSEWGQRPVLLEWRGDRNPAAHVACFTEPDEGHMQSIADDRLERVQRSRLRPTLGPLLYVVAIPFDVITFPVQAVIWLSRGGPG